MILSFHPCLEADVQVVLGSRKVSEEDVRLMERAEAVILPQGCSRDLWEASVRAGPPVFPFYDMRFRYPGKRGQSLLFERYDLPHPHTRRWDSVAHFRAVQENRGALPHGLPFMAKQDQEHEGRGVFFVEDGRSLEAALEALERKERSGLEGFITQEYVPTGAEVLRVVLMGERMVDYWKRPVDPSQVITTVGRGAVIDHEGSPELREKGRTLTRSLGQKTGINLAAMDFVFSPGREGEGREPLLLEINYFFGRRGLGGTETFYRLLYEQVRRWLQERGLDPGAVKLL